jgi:eukaryotic-like serine/threonine-protein kinase
MGAILRGRDVDLDRELAVKVLSEPNQGHPQIVRRFIEEAQIGGQLQHPGIVPVYELGAFADRRPYFVMKLVKGQTLATLLADRDSAGSAPPTDSHANGQSGPGGLHPP